MKKFISVAIFILMSICVYCSNEGNGKITIDFNRFKSEQSLINYLDQVFDSQLNIGYIRIGKNSGQFMQSGGLRLGSNNEVTIQTTFYQTRQITEIRIGYYIHQIGTGCKAIISCYGSGISINDFFSYSLPENQYSVVIGNREKGSGTVFNGSQLNIQIEGPNNLGKLANDSHLLLQYITIYYK